jgi:hypothetical protein
VYGGTLELSYAVTPTGLLAAGSKLAVAQGGSLELLGNSGAATASTETVASTTRAAAIL